MDIFKSQQDKTYLITSQYSELEFWTYFTVFTVIYSVIMIKTYQVRNKPHIQCRSPKLMLVIFFGCYIDTVTKLLIRYLPLADITAKCTLALITRVVFHNMIVIYVVVRIKRMNTVNKLQEITVHYLKQENLQQKVIKDTQEKARLLREERVCAKTFINLIAPLIILTLCSIFGSSLMFLTPIEEHDVCWLYYLTQAPFRQYEVTTESYILANVMKWVISFGELIVLFYYTFQVRNYSMQQINIKKESVLTTLTFITFEILYLIFKIFIGNNDNLEK